MGLATPPNINLLAMKLYDYHKHGVAVGLYPRVCVHTYIYIYIHTHTSLKMITHIIIVLTQTIK